MGTPLYRREYVCVCLTEKGEEFINEYNLQDLHKTGGYILKLGKVSKALPNW